MRVKGGRKISRDSAIGNAYPALGCWVDISPGERFAKETGTLDESIGMAIGLYVEGKRGEERDL